MGRSPRRQRPVHTFNSKLVVPSASQQARRDRLTSTAILAWSDRQKVAWHYIAPGKPVQNAFIEKVQRPSTRRAAERNLVPLTAACSRRARYLALGLQCRARAFEPWLANAVSLRRSPAVSVRATGRDALAIRGLRALSGCVGPRKYVQSPQDSGSPWMKSWRSR